MVVVVGSVDALHRAQLRKDWSDRFGRGLAAMGLEGAELAKKFKQDQKKKEEEPESKLTKSEPEAELEEEDDGIPF